MLVNVKRYAMNLPVRNGWQIFLFCGIGLTAIFVALNLGLSWQQANQIISNSLSQTNALTNFTQLVALPTLIGLVTLIIISILLAMRPQLPAVHRLSLLTLALVFFLTSQPKFAPAWLVPISSITTWVGAILTPPLFLHLLLSFPYPRKMLKTWPFILPLIYSPVLPGLIFLPTLFTRPELVSGFERFLNIFMGLYAIVGAILLIQAIVVGNADIRKRTSILLIGFILPVGLFILNGLNEFSTLFTDLMPIYEISGRYVLWSVPISAAFSILRYDIFGPIRLGHRQVIYTGIISILLILNTLLVGFAHSIPVGFSRVTGSDINTIFVTIMAYFMLRYLYARSRRWWTARHLYYSLEDFKTNVRILSRELLRMKSRRELESLISWNLATDFNLQSAEISTRNVANSPYALRLPLSVNNVPLGMLFLGPKINGDLFTKAELEVFSEAQRQIALALLSIELDQAIRITEELTRLKSKFLANVTHELRTPLNGIINYIGFVLDERETLNPEQLHHLTQAMQGAEKLLELINNILDMSKIEAEQMMLLKRPVELRTLVSETKRAAHELIADKSVRLITYVSPNLPIFYGDRMRLRQIILNLLSNAVKFTNDGTIKLDVYPENGSLVIKVADTGPGIDETILPTIFEQFATDGLIDTGRGLGTGLGLPITKSLVELHEGHIDVESKVEAGTIFTVKLPVLELE